MSVATCPPISRSVFAGDFASQPLAFAHLLDAAPLLDLTHVEVIRDPRPRPASALFRAATVAAIRHRRGERDTLILILPAAHDSAACPLGLTGMLTAAWHLSRHRPAHGCVMIEPGPRTSSPMSRAFASAMPRTRIKTGVTVLTADAPFTASVNVMGGAPGTRETDLLAPDRTVQGRRHLPVRGSAFGLDAAQGCPEGLRAGAGASPSTAPPCPSCPPRSSSTSPMAGTRTGSRRPTRARRARRSQAASEGFDLGTRARGPARCSPISRAVSARLRHVWRLHGRRARRRQPGGAGHGGRWPAFPRRTVRVRRRVRRPWPRARLRSHDNAPDQGHAVRAGGDRHRHRRHRCRAEQGARPRGSPPWRRTASRARSAQPRTHGWRRGLRRRDRGAPCATAMGAIDLMHLGHLAAICLSRAIARGVYHATPAPGDPKPTYRDRFG
jgi:hypothetical protein